MVISTEPMPKRKNRQETQSQELEMNINNFNIKEIKKIITQSKNSYHQNTKDEKHNASIDQKEYDHCSTVPPQSSETDTKNCPVCFSESTDLIDLGCNHFVCFICVCRIFYLIKDKKCPVCKGMSNIEPSKHLLILKCQRCSFVARSTLQLINHYKKHEVVLCELCIESKHEFPFEYTLYSINKLLKHKSNGLREENAGGFYGHIHCSFCNKYFYDAEACKKHCRVAHCVCTVCEIAGIRHNYFNTIDDLNVHYNEMHHVCYFAQCNGLVFGFQSALDEHLYRIHKVGNGNLDINTVKKISSKLISMKPFEIEKENRNKARNKVMQISSSCKKNQNSQRSITKGKREVHGDNSLVPKCFDRKIENLELRQFNMEFNYISKNYTNICDELFQNSRKYQRKEITPRMFLETVEMLLGKDGVYQFVENITKYYKEDVRDSLISYSKEIKQIKNIIPISNKIEKAENVIQPKKKEIKQKFKLFEVKKK